MKHFMALAIFSPYATRDSERRCSRAENQGKENIGPGRQD